MPPFQANEKAETSAMREAIEEAGAVGQLGRCLGIYDNAERKHRTKVYVLRSVDLFLQSTILKHETEFLI